MRILKAQHSGPMSRFKKFYGRVNGILSNLPASAGKRTLKNLLRHRLKDEKGRYYINISPSKKDDFDLAPAFFTAREVYHILNKDPVKINIIKTIATLALSIFSVFIAEWGLIASSGLLVLGNIITTYIQSQHMESSKNK